METRVFIKAFHEMYLAFDNSGMQYTMHTRVTNNEGVKYIYNLNFKKHQTRYCSCQRIRTLTSTSRNLEDMSGSNSRDEGKLNEGYGK